MRRMAMAAISAAMALALAGEAAAATVSKTYDFTARNFLSMFGAEIAPTDPVLGSITVQFDPTVDTSDTTAGITLNSLNIAHDSAPQFYFLHSFFGVMGISGVQGGEGVQGGTNDFSFTFFGAADPTPNTALFSYTTAASHDFFYTHDVTFNPVPEPAAWTMLLTGFAVAGAHLRRRGTVVGAA